MKKLLILVIATMFIADEVMGQTQWDVFNSISSIKRIDLDFSDDNYVFLNSTYKSNNDASGFWNASKYHPVNLHFTIYGDYSASFCTVSKRYERDAEYSGKGSGLRLVLDL